MGIFDAIFRYICSHAVDRSSCEVTFTAETSHVGVHAEHGYARLMYERNEEKCMAFLTPVDMQTVEDTSISERLAHWIIEQQQHDGLGSRERPRTGILAARST